MKTDLVEIFQTIRASLQPYASRGYTTHHNTDKSYDLYSEKNVVVEHKKSTERFFAGVYIEGAEVLLKVNAANLDREALRLIQFEHGEAGLVLTALDAQKMKEIEALIAFSHAHFKEKEWI